ncbi:hypothetical protein [Pseudoalteromonas denitrificans]|uniref:Lipoprotein n=1 Tax=Pseudoalteromonas denitrificans DSM 6059 TaxID=1123010 RepID=A0A1I1R5N8_9GAMM|nr:hypothetical protein [Pseudoalteromonas denitrificans]SFD26873.1 hypothetical protein SAMN02745724_04041 [Pseudoalteromonas denitrificans DSM 6059]
MTLISKKFRNSALALSIVFTVTGCGGGSDKVDTLLDDLTPKDKSANITFVNALDEMASFYVQIRDLNRDVFSDEDKASDIAVNEISSPYKHAWGESLNNTTFGVQDANSQTKKDTLNQELTADSNVFAVAWLSGTDYQLSVFDKQASDKADVYSIRVFANSQMSVKINDSDQVVQTTEIGKVTQRFEVNNCETGLKVSGNYIDLCTLDLGKSYLVVADTNGKRVLIQE